MPTLKRYKLHLIVAITFLIIGILAGNKMTPVETKVETIAKEAVKERVVIQTRTVRSPDGTVIIEQKKTKDIDSVSQIETKQESRPAGKKWHVSVDASVGRELKPFYGVQVERQLLGPVSVGVRATTEGTIGVVLGLSF